MKKTNKIGGFFAEFKKFITRGNVLDMAVGVIVGSAFTAIVNALSNNILKPLINWLLAAILGKDALSEVFTMLKTVTDPATGLIDLTQSIYIDWGAFINAIINFLLIAFVLFCIVKTLNEISEAHDKAKEGYLTERAAVKKYRKSGMKKADAVAAYREDLKKEAEAKAEEERIAKEKADAEAKAADEKARENTRLLEEIRDLLKGRA